MLIPNIEMVVTEYPSTPAIKTGYGEKLCPILGKPGIENFLINSFAELMKKYR